jgi:tRNA/rRNA methyltransferase
VGSFPPLPLRVVLVEPRNPLNIGAAARALSNFGFAELRLVKPYEVAFQEARSAVRSRYVLEQARVFDTVAEAVSDCALVVGSTAGDKRDLHIPLYRLETAARVLHDALARAPAAILFGSEKFGLSNEHLSHCQWGFRIPARAEHGSMNLGQAVAVSLYELRREVSAEAQLFPAPTGLVAADAERATVLLLEILRRSGYTQERTSVSSEQKLRRLIRRAHIPASDGETWLGILRQILWKLRGG